MCRRWLEASGSGSELAKLVKFSAIPRPVPARKSRIYAAAVRGPGVESSFPLARARARPEIRARVKAKLPIDHLVAPAVAEAIRNYHLYL